MTEQKSIKLAVMMSALNEEKTIGRVIDAVPRGAGMPAEVQVIVVDDGSEDATGRIAAEKGAIVIRHPQREGLGRSFAEGLERALEEGADVIVNIDADGQFDAGDIPELIRPILQGDADMVTASRFACPNLAPGMPWVKRWGNRQMCRLVNFVTGRTSLTDASCGFRAYSLQAALHLHLSGNFTHVQETIIALADKGLRIKEVPLAVRGVREHGRSRMAGSLLRYAWGAGGTVLRALYRTRPLFFFGLLGAGVMGLGVLQSLAVFIHWWRTGQTRPIQSLLLGASLFITVGFLILVLAFLADMLNRATDVSERLLFYVKLDQYRGRRGRSSAPTRPQSPPAEGSPRSPPSP